MDIESLKGCALKYQKAMAQSEVIEARIVFSLSVDVDLTWLASIINSLISMGGADSLDVVIAFRGCNGAGHSHFADELSSKNVRVVADQSTAFIESLASAEKIFVDDPIGDYWLKRPGQKLYYLWSSIASDSCGKYDMSLSADNIATTQRELILADILIVPNNETLDMVTDAYDLKGLCSFGVFNTEACSKMVFSEQSDGACFNELFPPQAIADLLSDNSTDFRLNNLMGGGLVSFDCAYAADERRNSASEMLLYWLLDQSTDDSERILTITADPRPLVSYCKSDGLLYVKRLLDDDASIVDEIGKEYFWKLWLPPQIKPKRYVNLKTSVSYVDSCLLQRNCAITEWFFNWDKGVDTESVLKSRSLFEACTVSCFNLRELPAEYAENGFSVVDSMGIRAARKGKMAVLIIASYDSVNYALAAAAQELKSRGHFVYVISDGHDEYQNVRIFIEKGFVVERANPLRLSMLNFFDCVIMPPFRTAQTSRFYNRIRYSNLMVFSFSALFSSIVMRVYPDVVYTIGENKIREFAENCLNYNCVVAGNPQYDSLIGLTNSADAHIIKRVLIVEQGAYPHGSKGKSQLANAIKDIGYENPSISFYIKPRYIPGDNDGAIHKLSEHLYDYLKDRPDNIHLIMEAVNLEDILPDYDAMITLWSTSYIDALVAGKPLVLLEGFDSIDVFDVRKQRVADAYRQLKGTGCVYRYDNLSCLNDKFKLVDDEYSAKEVYCRETPSAPRIADHIEFCYEKLVLQGKRIKQPYTCTLDHFYAQFDQFEFEDAYSDSCMAKMKYMDMFNARMQEYVYENRCMGNVLDLHPLMRHYYIDFGDNPINDANLKYYLKVKRKALDTEYAAIKSRYFKSTENLLVIEQDYVLQDYYFEWLYNTKRFEEIKKPVIRVLAVASHEYYSGLVAIAEKDYSEAFTHLRKYLELASAMEVKQIRKLNLLKGSLKPFREGKLRLRFYLFLLDKDNALAVDYLYRELAEPGLMITMIEMRRFNRMGNYRECVSCAEKYRLEERIGRNNKKSNFKSFAKRIAYSLMSKELRIANNSGKA